MTDLEKFWYISICLTVGVLLLIFAGFKAYYPYMLTIIFIQTVNNQKND